MGFFNPITQQYENGVKKVSWWHEAIVDWELANPHLTMNDCAAFFQVSPSWLSTVRNSDAFRAYSTGRRAQYNEMVAAGMTVQLGSLASECVGIMLDKVRNERESLDFGQAKDGAAMALKALGFGAKPMGNPDRLPTTVNNTVNFNVVTPEVLARAREKMQRLNSPQSHSQPQPALIEHAPQIKEAAE